MAPKLIEDLTDGNFVTPDKIQLSCRISPGQPTAEIHWFRDGKEIYKNKKYEMAQDGDTMTLTIATSEPTDSATYACEAVNKLGRVKTQCSIVVNSKCSHSPKLLIESHQNTQINNNKSILF